MKIFLWCICCVILLLNGCLPGNWRERTTYYEYQPSNDKLSMEYSLRGHYEPDTIVVKIKENIYVEQLERSILVEEEYKSLFQKAPIIPIGVGVGGTMLSIEASKLYKEKHDKWLAEPWRNEEDEPTAWLPALAIVGTGALVVECFKEGRTGKERQTESDWHETDQKSLYSSEGAKKKSFQVILADNARDVLAVDSELMTDDNGVMNVPVRIIHRDYISESSSKWESNTLQNTHEEFFYATIYIPEDNVSCDIRLGPYKNINVFNR